MKNFKVELNILIPIILLALISIISIYSSLIFVPRNLGNLALKQGLWYVLGFFITYIFFKYKGQVIFDYSFIFYIIGIILLALLLIFGTPVNNSKCWFTIGPISFQPSEFAKIFIILELSNNIDRFKKKYTSPTLMQEFIFILKSFSIVLIPALLTFLQPDTGAVIIYFVIFLFMIFSSGIRIRWFGIFLVLIIVSLSFLLITYFKYDSLFIKLFGSSFYYRMNRLLDWKNGSSLQLENAIVSIGSAGLFGKGFNNSPIYFPEAYNDFIFAIFASNFGFFGCFLLILTFLYFYISLFKISKRKITNRNKYILFGIWGMILFQQIQNIGMTIGLVPIIGITLPFISYGGSSLFSYILIIGIIFSISSENVINRKKQA